MLLSLLKVVGATAGVGVVVLAPSALEAIDMFVRQHDKRKNSRLKEYLKKQEYFDVVQSGSGRFVIKLTEKGIKRHSQTVLENYSPLPDKHRWDGKWHLIMFDIDEKHKNSRDYIARAIKNMNLAPIQDSVYAYPYSLEELAKMIRQQYPTLGRNVISLRADRIEGGDQLKKHFIKIL